MIDQYLVCLLIACGLGLISIALLWIPIRISTNNRVDTLIMEANYYKNEYDANCGDIAILERRLGEASEELRNSLRKIATLEGTIRQHQTVIDKHTESLAQKQTDFNGINSLLNEALMHCEYLKIKVDAQEGRK